MAIIPPGARCSLCGQELTAGEPCFSTSGSFLPESDANHRHCGQPMHWDCYANWPERPAFARAYVAEWTKANRKNPFWWSVLQNGEAYISVNPQRGIEEASVRLMQVGNDIRVPLDKWALWVKSPAEVIPDLHAFELEELARIAPKLQRKFPDARAVVQAIDPREKK